MATKTGKIIILLVLALAWCALPADAAGKIEVTLQAGSPVVRVGEAVNLTVAVSGGGGKKPELAGLENFSVVASSSGRNVQIINGVITVAHTYTYRVVAQREGRNEITAFVKTRKGRVKSNPVQLTVVGQSQAPPPAQAPGAGRSARSREGAADPIFLRPVVKPKNPVVGSQVTIEYYLYIREGVRPKKYQLSDLPEFTGFVAHELATSNTLSFVQENVGGVNYQVALVKRWALFPVAAGEATIGSLGMVLEVPRRSTRRNFGWDPFEDLDQFFSFGRPMEVQSEPMKIAVKPLPKQGRPENWQGAVGSYRLTANLDRTELPVGEPLELHLVVSGEGNVDSVRRPEIRLDEGVRIYSENEQSSMVPGADTVGGEKTFMVILIAAKPGEHVIGPIELPFYNIDEGRYQIAKTEELKFTATGEALDLQAQAPGVLSRESVELRGRDLRYIRADKDRLRMRRRPLVASPAVWIALGLWPLLVLGLVLYQVRAGRLRADRRTWRSRRAMTEAKRRLAKLKRMTEQALPAAFYTELHGALMNFLADKLDAAAPGLDRKELAELLRRQEVGEESIERLLALWSEADRVRFAGEQADQAARKESYQKVRDLLADLSRQWEE